jgi:(1->4)-alpha-D-glucan 1-alpha-D-glucosylmutase
VPGIPDLYQGDELWNHLLVDPDNRRPVDWELRTTLLSELRTGGARPHVDRATAKLFTTCALLAVRTKLGDPTPLPYRPIDLSPDVCSFFRGDHVVVSVPLRADLAHPGPGALGLRDADRWTDVLAPLDAVYGERRPVVYVDLD